MKQKNNEVKNELLRLMVEDKEYKNKELIDKADCVKSY